MLKKLLSSILFLLTIKTYSQINHDHDYILTILNDTIHGELKEINYFRADRIKLHTNKGYNKYNYKYLKELRVDGERYIRNYYVKQNKHSDTLYFGHFVKPLIEKGNIKVFKWKKAILLSERRSIFSKKQLKYYADDYPSTTNFLKQRNNSDSLISFIKAYNVFNEQNPNSKCFAERNFHFKKILNPQLCVNFLGIIPIHGYLGIELGLNKVITLAPRLSYLLGKVNDHTTIIPFAELETKCYLFNKLRMKNERSTYKYSGFYISLAYMQPLQVNIVHNIRSGVGFKLVSFNNFYVDYNVGAIHYIENNITRLWFTIGYGYSF